MEKNKCNDCGASNPVGSVICGSCGKPFIEQSKKDEENIEKENINIYAKNIKKSQFIIFKICSLSLLFILFLSMGIYLIFSDNQIRHGNGMIATADPIQKNILKSNQKKILFNGNIITCLAEFEITARVLAIEHYYLDKESQYAPLDFVLGWGSMSDEKVLDQIEITQSERVYYWYTESYPIPKRLIEQKSANMHIIPKSETQEKTLLNIRVGNLVEIKGYLVKINSDGWSWKSSLTRKDTGPEACELIFAEEIKILK